MEMQFRICRICGNIVGIVNDSGAPIYCCGQEMETLVPNTVDAAFEKHVPQIAQNGCAVHICVGEEAHPMTAQHYIQWIAIRTKAGAQRKELRPGEAPEAEFALCEGDELICAYAYCNLHGLWGSKAGAAKSGEEGR